MASSKNMQPVTSGPLSTFFQVQPSAKVPSTPEGVNLDGQTAIVTGSSSGLGFECARQLLALGISRLIVAVRSVERGLAAASKLQSANPSAKIEVWHLEMESYKSVQEFTTRCDKELQRIDLVILNAGLAEMDFSLAPTGHEKTIQVNYLSTVLLVILLLPVLKGKASAEQAPKITVVNSIMSAFAAFPNRDARPLLSSFDDTKVTPWDPSDRYSVSKLLCQLFLSRLCESIKSEDVTVNMVEPGLTRGTSLFRNSHGISGAVFGIVKRVSARPVEVGARTFVDAAVVKGKESHGCFLVNCSPYPYASIYYEPGSKGIMDRLWDETLDEFQFVGAREIIQSLA